MRSQGSALIETLLILPLWMTALACLAAVAMTGRLALNTLDAVHHALWGNQTRAEAVVEVNQALSWTQADFPRRVTKAGRLNGHDGAVADNTEFLAVVHEDGWIPEPVALQWSQAIVELIRRLGAPAPFSETRSSRLTPVGVVGDLHMPLPKRIRPDA